MFAGFSLASCAFNSGFLISAKAASSVAFFVVAAEPADCIPPTGSTRTEGIFALTFSAIASSSENAFLPEVSKAPPTLGATLAPPNNPKEAIMLFTSSTGKPVFLEISAPTTAGGQPILKPLGGGMTQPSQGTPPPVTQPPTQLQGAPQSGITPTQMSLQYPVRKAGDLRPFAPNEAIDTEKGASYRNSLTTRQTDLSASRRNLDEVIKAAVQIDKEDLFSTGVLGALTRTVKGWAGDPKYKQLSKDLANVQISNIQAQGGSMDTVAGQQLTKMANGDET